MVYQPTLEISIEASEGVNSGKYEIIGGIVRNTDTKQVVEWARDTTPEISKQNTEPINEPKEPSLTDPNSEDSIGKEVCIGVCIDATIALVGWGAYKFFKWLTKDKSKPKEETKATKLHFVVAEYISHINNQNMSLSAIKNTIAFLDSISNGNDVTIEISDEEMTVLRNITTRYLAQLCEANNVPIENKVLLIDAKAQPKELSLKEIKSSLAIQEKIFS